MNIQRNVSLKQYNTFGIDVQAFSFCTIASIEELQRIVVEEQKKFPSISILGGGSNILLTRDIHALVVRIGLKGIAVVREDEGTLDIEVRAGENWDTFVQHAVRHNWGGIENLSLIPGSVGAAPVQNIGAYGVELKNLILRVQGVMRSSGEIVSLSQEECGFGYRDSVFKRELRDAFIITSVVVRLRKQPSGASLQIQYGTLRQELERLFPAISSDLYTIHHVREAVCAIRRSKLPSPDMIGNAGSFFKNPEISLESYHRIKKTYPDVPSFPANTASVKIPAAWLIEKCGWKGKRLSPTSDAAVHDKQALVLVNHGTATGKEILELSGQISLSVQERFGIGLETEVNIW